MNLERFLLNSDRIPRLVFASGAGLSKESGINTFRDAQEDGLWEQHSIDEVCNIATFYVNYEKVHNFYNMRRQALSTVEPNIGHELIARIEQLYGEDRVIHITANVDDLTERAGGTAMHVHGKLTEVIEPFAQNNKDYVIKNIGYNEHIPTPGIISKPNVVLFGEADWYTEGKRKPIYDDMYKVLDSLRPMDTVIVIGSSDTVIPWSVYAGLATSAQTLNVNPMEHDNDDYFTFNLYHPITQAANMVEQFITDRMNYSILY